MSTRCNIVIRDKSNFPFIVYHHCDGYPKGVGKDLDECLTNYIKFGEKFQGKLMEDEFGENYTFDLSKYTQNQIFEIIQDYDLSFEYDGNIHGDIEYLYVIDIKDDYKNCTLTCYKVPLLKEYKTFDELDIIFQKDFSI